MGTIPTPAEISNEWLATTLTAAGFDRCEVTESSVEPIGTGQAAACARIRLVYADSASSAPATLIAKYPAESKLSRTSATSMGIYRREVEFYRDVAPRLSISLPEIYYLDVDDSGEQFLILMEDLAPARQGDQLAGCDASVVRTAVLELVGLQAPTWCDATLGVRFREPEDGFFSDMHAVYNQALPQFVERFGEHLAADELAIIQRLAACPTAPLFQPVGEPYCLEHRDYRLDNFMIDISRSPPRVVVVDWQGMRTGRPLNDIALCIASSLRPEERRAVEQEILRDYHAALMDAGVAHFSWAQCWHEYRRASFAGFGLTVVAAVAVEQTERGDAMFRAMARRYARHALDVNADAFLAPSDLR